MEKLKEQKFCQLNDKEMKKITGGKFNHWNQIYSGDCGTVEQLSNWWGLHETTEIRQD